MKRRYIYIYVIFFVNASYSNMRICAAPQGTDDEVQTHGRLWSTWCVGEGHPRQPYWWFHAFYPFDGKKTRKIVMGSKDRVTWALLLFQPVSNSHSFNRKYIFKWLFFHCHGSFPGCSFWRFWKPPFCFHFECPVDLGGPWLSLDRLSW